MLPTRRADCIIAVLNDTHTGSPVGLTFNPQNPCQERLLSRFDDAVEWFGERPDWVVHVGEHIEGTHPILTKTIGDYDEQMIESTLPLVYLKPRQGYQMVLGTGIHTKHHQSPFVNSLRNNLRLAHIDHHNRDCEVEISNKLTFRIFGWWIGEFRHFVGRSIIFHGRATPALREQMNAILNAALDSYLSDRPARWPNLLCFAHTHYYLSVGDAYGSILVNPGWKGIGDYLRNTDLYGDKRFSDHIAMGLSKIEIWDKERAWRKTTRVYQAKLARTISDYLNPAESVEEKQQFATNEPPVLFNDGISYGKPLFLTYDDMPENTHAGVYTCKFCGRQDLTKGDMKVDTASPAGFHKTKCKRCHNEEGLAAKRRRKAERKEQ